MSVTTLLPGLLAVEVPKGADSFSFNHNEGHVLYYRDNTKYNNFGRTQIDLPFGSYEIVGLVGALKEAQWQNIIPIHYDPPGRKNMRIWLNYHKGDSNFCTAKEAGISLLSSHGLTDKNNLLILKEVK